MAHSGESSSAPPEPTNEKPVIVRVKRKATQEPLDAFWLEINERSLKRPLLDFEKLSISDSYVKGELKARKVFVQHVDTVNTSEATIDIVQSFLTNFANALDSKTKSDERRRTFKKDNDQNFLKARQQQEVLAKMLALNKYGGAERETKSKCMIKCYVKCVNFLILFVWMLKKDPMRCQSRITFLEDQRLLASYIPMLREFLPTAAAEIESDMRDYMSKQDDFVYDYYTVNGDMNVDDKDASHPFPLVQVDDEEFDDGPDESEYDSQDSNAEDNPRNDYPDEMSDEEGEKEEEEEEVEKGVTSMASNESDGNESSTSSASRDVDLIPKDEIYDNDFDNDDINSDYYNNELDDDDGDSEDWRWSYR